MSTAKLPPGMQHPKLPDAPNGGAVLVPLQVFCTICGKRSQPKLISTSNLQKMFTALAELRIEEGWREYMSKLVCKTCLDELQKEEMQVMRRMDEKIAAAEAKATKPKPTDAAINEAFEKAP